MAETICNTSPIQYLHQTGLLNLLPAVYGRITIPQAVLLEINEGHRGGVMLPWTESLPWIDVKQVSHGAMLAMVSDLDPGEREVLALAIESPASLAILDDRLARRHAQILRIRFIGTLGILLLAKRRGYLPAVAPVLDELERLRFRLDPSEQPF